MQERLPAEDGAVLADFAAAVTAAGQGGSSGPELLAERLAVAAASVLPADGAGLSLVFASGRRLPVGASDALAATAERLQFTVGEGPCLQAQDTRRPVLGWDGELGRRWPAFWDELVRLTPYRGVVSLPLPDQLEGLGALDLFFTRSDDVLGLSLADSLAVTTEVTRLFHGSMVVAARDARTGAADGDATPAWLDAPAALSRARVWQALGFLNTTLGVTTTDALALLRARAYGEGSDVDELADRIVSGELPAEDLARGHELTD